MPDFSNYQYEDLILSLFNGACIFFGAGISKFAGYKLWTELREALVDYFWEKRNVLSSRYTGNKNFDLSLCENLKNHISLIESFDFLYNIDSKLFIDGIKGIFQKDSRTINNDIYYYLKKLDNGRNNFVTTNIDRSFQKYLEITDENISIYPDFFNPPKLITYLHGRIDKENTWIFTRAQYNRGYEGEGACKNYLKNIFMDRSVLFIGYGLREEEIVRAIYLTDKSKTHYWLEGYTRNNIDFLKIRSTSLKENYNIHLIPYCIDNRERHRIIFEIIDSLHKKINGKEGI